MNKIEGRILDTIILREGRKIYGHIFAQILFKHVQNIRQFQIHQTAIDEIVIRVVPNGLDIHSSTKDNIVDALRKYTGSLMNYSFDVVNEIKREKSGKLRHVKSDLSCDMAKRT
jgi:phenylacetate-coenzyme A ligase PaaK-like adenylate-forming protein